MSTWTQRLARALRLARRGELGSALLRKSFPLWERLGVHVTPVHYSQPIPDSRSLGDEIWDTPGDLPGVEMNEPEQLELLATFAARYRDEYEVLCRRPASAAPLYACDSSMLIPVDAAVLYALIRHARPRRIVEIGSGDSTLVAAEALLANARDGGAPGALIAVEPRPRPVLRAGFPGLSELIARRLQEVPAALFDTLGDGDVLFVDSSHVLTIGSDVQRLYLEILPRLRRGVLVHVHDIFLPDEYPRSWVEQNRWFWNEQYLLQAFLAFNDSFRVLWAGAYLARRHGALLDAAFSCRARDRRRPGSFWMRRTR